MLMNKTSNNCLKKENINAKPRIPPTRFKTFSRFLIISSAVHVYVAISQSAHQHEQKPLNKESTNTYKEPRDPPVAPVPFHLCGTC